MRNHEVTTPQPLLNAMGNIEEPGFARTPIWEYSRKQIKAPKFRIKEWDYYLVMGQGFAGAFTLSDDGYVGLQSVSLLVFDKKPWEHTETVLDFFPMGKLKLPVSSSEGDIIYSSKRLNMRFEKTPGQRRIKCDFADFYEHKPFSCNILLDEPPMDSMVIATPWPKKHHFYYNQKINCMRASGYMEYDGKRYEFCPNTDFGTLDWGRGVWTYDNTWNWGSMNTDIDGKAFGFNIGYGFGDTTAASENVLFYDGVVHKLDDVTFHIPENKYMDPWKFSSSDGRFEMDFVPVLDRKALLDYKLIVTDQHQVFGKMSGKAILDDGKSIEIKDVMCFAERVHNRY